MSTLRVSNIEAKADPSSPSVDEKLKVTNSNGDVLVHIDGKTAGITTVGINTTDRSFTVDAAQNIEFIGIVTATKFSLSGSGEITGGDGNFTGIVTSTSISATDSTIGVATITSLTASAANFTGNVSIAGTLTYEDVTNVDSIGIATARTGIDVTGGHIDLVDNSKIRVGTGDDLEIYHDGSHSWINDQGVGHLYITTNGDRVNINGGNDSLAKFNKDGSVELYYDNSKKLETTTTGAKVTGALEVTQEYPSIRPTLDLNFAATKTLDRRITFTRDSVGTFTDENGMVKYASNNVPRFDHDPTTGESLGLLIEESRTNILYGTPSQSNTINSYNQYNSLTGKYDATKLAKNSPSSNQSHGSWNWNGNLSTSSFVMSIFVKKVNHASFFIQMISNGVGDNLYVYYNIDTKVTSIVDNASPGNLTVTRSIENYSDGWFRLVARVEGFSNTALNSGIRFGFASGGSNTQQYQDTSDEVLIYGAQAEVGDFATSYIPTHESTTSVTRAQDFAKITGTNFTDFYNQEEGTLVCDQSVSDLGTANQYSVAFTSNVNESIGMGYRVGGGASGNYGFYIIKSGDALFRNVSGISADTPFRTALAYKLNDGATVINGESAVADTSLVLPTPDRMLIGEGFSANNEMTKGHIRKISYYNKRLPNAQLQGLTQQ